MTVSDELLVAVAELMREASTAAIEPRFHALGDGDVIEKAAGELVTVADREAEALITDGLARLDPGVPVVGEEAVAADPTRLEDLAAPRVWVVDPLDGTANFVNGSPDWAVMVALILDGATAASWIWQPLERRMYAARRGRGATCNGRRLVAAPRPRAEAELTGAVLTRYLDQPTRERVDRNVGRFGTVTAGRHCAGIEYPALIDGTTDFAFFWRTLPWDHAPGTLLVEEAGGVAARPDGSPYRPGPGGVGLLVAADRPTWDLAQGLLD